MICQSYVTPPRRTNAAQVAGTESAASGVGVAKWEWPECVF